MKFSSLLLLSGLFLTAFSGSKTKFQNSPYLPKYFVLIPGGKVVVPGANGNKLTDSCGAFYISDHEVSNREYREFVFWMKQYRNHEWEQFLPDTLVWSNKNAYHEPYVKFYFQHPAYLDYPVVGITRTQAEAYCKWLTDIYIPKKKGVKPNFMLPEKKQWIRAARGSDSRPYPHKGPFLRNHKGNYLANFRVLGDESIRFDQTTGSHRVVAGRRFDISDGYATTAKCSSYWPNEYGVYNMSGNVAELIAHDSIAMGGSWNDPGYDVRIESKQSASQASSQIGFRIIAILPFQ